MRGIRFPQKEAIVDEETTGAVLFSEKVMSAAMSLLDVAKVKLTEDWARDPKIVALAILCRSISNFRAAMLLVQERHAMEARALGRGLYENVLWTAGLRERGPAFVNDMLKDEAFNRKSLGQLTLELSKKQGADLSAPDSRRLCDLLRDTAKKFPNPEKISPGKISTDSAIRHFYFEYMRLSLDGVHCSITALGRHLATERVSEDLTEVIMNLEPRTTDHEARSVIFHLCNALLAVALGANELLGFTAASEQLKTVFDELGTKDWAEADEPTDQQSRGGP
jgi:hypothetical protein